MNRKEREYLLNHLLSERDRRDNPKHPVYQSVTDIVRKINKDDWSFSEEEFMKCFTKHTPEAELQTCLEIYERCRVAKANS